MKAKIKIWKTDGITENGYPVKLILSHNRITKRKTIFYSFLEDWDIVSQLPEMDHDDFEELYTRIMDIRKKAFKMEFKELEDFDDAFDFLIYTRKIKKVSFFEWADERIKFMDKQNRKGNAEAYQTAKNQLEKFSPKLNFSDLTPVLLEGFKQFKKAEGVKNSTIRNYLVEIKAMYNSAVKSGITEDEAPFKNLFTDLSIKKRRQRNRYLSEKELKNLEAFKLPQKSFQRSIDFSLLQFYLCGVDLIDLYFLKNENIENNRVFLKRKKLGERGYEFDILIPEKAHEIISKYSDFTGEYLFPWRKDYSGYKTFRNNHNRNLKNIQERFNIRLSPKNDSFTSKVMRHTFATLGKFARVEEDLLRELMGHERNDIDTVYKDKYPEDERDAAQLKIIILIDS